MRGGEGVEESGEGVRNEKLWTEKGMGEEVVERGKDKQTTIKC